MAGENGTSEEIPLTAPFPALPKTAQDGEFLRFQPRLASLDSRLIPGVGLAAAEASYDEWMYSRPPCHTAPGGFFRSGQFHPLP